MVATALTGWMMTGLGSRRAIVEEVEMRGIAVII
jgi:hypothetical protein